MSDNKPQKPAAFIFGKRPETISAPVKFTSVTGAEVDIECQFKYRTRKEFAEFWDEAKPTDLEDVTSYASLAEKDMDAAAERMLKFLSGWPLEIEFSKVNIVQMLNEEPAALDAFWQAYRKVIIEGRQGN